MSNSIIWKTIENFSEYQVSNTGRVRKIRKVINLDGQCVTMMPVEVRPYVNNGFLYVTLSGRCISIHKLVAENFIKNTNKFSRVLHIDGNRLNNRADNLTWISNFQHMENVRNSKNYQESKRNSKRVEHVESGMIFPSVRSAYLAIRDSISSSFSYDQLCAAIKEGKSYKGVTLVPYK